MFTIGKRPVGGGAPCYIIAEAGVNHGGSLRTAKELVDAAAAAGADAVKFQSYRTADLVVRQAPKAAYQRRTTGTRTTQFEMLEQLELSAAQQRQLQTHCRKVGITFLSTPFDPPSVRLLTRLRVPAFKVSSCNLVNTPLLEQIAAVGRPMILSTGMASLSEVEMGLAAVERHLPRRKVALLQCTSNYPSSHKTVNLRAMDTLAQAFGTVVGLSDHSPGIAAALAAVARGAAIVEKHFTLDRALPGPDHAASLLPTELGELVRGIRAVEAALGDGRKAPQAGELDVRTAARKSLVLLTDVRAGATLTRRTLGFKRPGTGIPASAFDHVLGRKVRTALRKDHLLCWEDLR